MVIDADAIVRYEHGELSEDETIELFQGLIDSGMAWNLQGSYGRTAQALIDAGLCSDPRERRAARPELVGTFCECGAPYDPELPGYACAR